jgi:hypothetical protein
MNIFLKGLNMELVNKIFWNPTYRRNPSSACGSWSCSVRRAVRNGRLVFLKMHNGLVKFCWIIIQ